MPTADIEQTRPPLYSLVSLCPTYNLPYELHQQRILLPEPVAAVIIRILASIRLTSVAWPSRAEFFSSTSLVATFAIHGFVDVGGWGNFSTNPSFSVYNRVGLRHAWMEVPSPNNSINDYSQPDGIVHSD